MPGKIQVLGTGLLALSACTAQAGLYVGAGVGPDNVQFIQRADVAQPPSGPYPAGFHVINNNHLSGTGVFGTLFAGYSRLFRDAYYMAAEINANWSSVVHTQFNHEYINVNFANTSIKMNNSIGISILPGYQYTPNMLFYGRVGYTNANLKQTTGDTSLISFSNRVNGIRYGLGLKQALTEKVDLRIEYSRINYGGIKTRYVDAQIDKTTIVSPTQQLFELGFVYKFA